MTSDANRQTARSEAAKRGAATRKAQEWAGTRNAQEKERASLIALATMQGATFADVPGRYDGSGDRKLAQALDVLDPDEEGGDVEALGHGRRYGRFILTTDSQGSLHVCGYDTIDEAREHLGHLAAATVRRRGSRGRPELRPRRR